VSQPLFAGLLAALAKAVGVGPKKRVVLLLDTAGFHTRHNLALPDGLRLVYLPPYSPELQPAETLWPLVDEPIVNKLVPTLDALVNTIGARSCDLTERQSEISSRTPSLGGPKTNSQPNLADFV
jgi:transposase